MLLYSVYKRFGVFSVTIFATTILLLFLMILYLGYKRFGVFSVTILIMFHSISLIGVNMM